MDFPMLLSDAVKMYDNLVEVLSASSTDESFSKTRNPHSYHQFRTICRVLLEIHNQDTSVFSEKQRDTVALSLAHAEAILDQLNGPDGTTESDGETDLDIRWNRPTLTIHWGQNEIDDKQEDDNIIDCWGDRDELEQEEAMLLAMASTPIPSESDTTSNKRSNECLDAAI
jgi:hypothetical protein